MIEAPALLTVRALAPQRRSGAEPAALVYLRVSDPRTKDSGGPRHRKAADETSIPAQLEACRAYAARLGVPIAKELIPDLRSGMEADRVSYQQLLSLVRTHRYSHVIVFKMDRLGRDSRELLSAFDVMEKASVELHDTTKGHITPEMAGLHGWLANKEARDISSRVLPVMLQRAAAGKAMTRPPLGYAPHRDRNMRGVFVPDEHAPYVTELFRRYAAGTGLHALAAWLNGATGLVKVPSHLRWVLANPFYCGLVVFNRSRHSKFDGRYGKPREEWVISEHPYPLIDRATWDACQARLRRNGKQGQERQGGARYPLVGLVWCASCGQRCHGGTNKTSRYYYCRALYEEKEGRRVAIVGCARSRSNAKVEPAFRSLLARIPLGAEAIEARLRTTGRTTVTTMARLAEIGARTEKLQARRTRLTVLLADEQISRRDYERAIAESDTELAALAAEAESLDAEQTTDAGIEVTIAWLKTLTCWTTLVDDASTVEERNAIYKELAERVSIDFDNNTITATWTPAIARLLGEPTATAAL